MSCVGSSQRLEKKKSSEMSLRVVRGLASGAGAGFSSTSGSAGGISSMTSSAPKPAASYQGSTNGRGEPHGDGKRVFSSGRASLPPLQPMAKPHLRLLRRVSERVPLVRRWLRNVFRPS